MNKYTIYADMSYMDQKALSQFYDAMKQSYVVQGALMPDAHFGYSLPIGGVIATDGYIVPAWVGYDIGCGMCAVKTSFHSGEVNYFSNEIFDSIYRTVPTGFNHNTKPVNWNTNYYEKSDYLVKMFKEKNGLHQLGTLGSCNHFIEIGFDETNNVWVIVHSGSRNVGHSVATHYMKLASPNGKASEGHHALHEDSVEGNNYIKDMTFCLAFALENREEIIMRVVKEISNYCDGSVDHSEGLINRNHNHADFKDGVWIHRKGATHAEEGMMGVIPGNMRDGSFIVCGKGNPDSLYSSSHGAGRVLGRKQAKETLDMEIFEYEMKGITAKVGPSTLDESADAYKNIFDVMEQQKELVEIVHRIKPIINIKA